MLPVSNCYQCSFYTVKYIIVSIQQAKSLIITCFYYAVLKVIVSCSIAVSTVSVLIIHLPRQIATMQNWNVQSIDK